MPYDKAVDSAALDAGLTAIANAIREKTGSSDALAFPDAMAAAIAAIQNGSSGASTVSKKDVNFYDYDGTLLHSYTVEEARSLTELPAGPEHDGLVFQKWNWSLESINALTRAMDVGAQYKTDDGTTRIYIHLEEGRTSPMLGIGVNGTVTVDWGDNTDSDTLTGTSVTPTVWTSNHEYNAPGDYVIRLTADGSIAFTGKSSTNEYSCLLRHSTLADARNGVYRNAIRKIECGDSVTSIGSNAFSNCYSLASITIPDSVASISSYAFIACYSLASITIPDSVGSISSYAFIGCYSLASITIPDSVTSIGSNAFSNCYSLASITIPDSVTSISSYAFGSCHSLASITIPDSVTLIVSNTFIGCYGIRFYDFSNHTAVPTLSATSAFKNISSDCEIRVPSTLYDEWIAATNWSTYTDYIVAV